MTKSFIVAAALTLLAVPAFAQEGNGNPFPLRTPGVSTLVSGAQPADLGSAAYPDVRGRAGSALQGSVSPVVGLANEAPVQSANSQPVGFTDGTGFYASVPARSRVATQDVFAFRG